MTDVTSPLPYSESRPVDSLLSVVLPVYNEGAVLHRLLGQVLVGLKATECRYEIIFVNDGSTDGSAEILDLLAATDSSVRVLHFSRNFGHQAAVHAGLSHAKGDAVILMDSDLQDDPNAIAKFVAAWKQGNDVVYAVRTDRKENIIKRGLFSAFYRVLNFVSSTSMPMDAGNFGLIDRKVATEVCSLIECDRYYPGLRSWVGFQQIGISVERKARHDNEPRVSIWGLFRLAKTALFSFSSAPLSMFYYVAIYSMLACTCLGGYALVQSVLFGVAISSWISTTVLVSYFGAINALGVAILGEYLTRIYDQVRQRPTYIIARESKQMKTEVEEIPSEERLPLENNKSPEELLDWLETAWSGVMQTS